MGSGDWEARQLGLTKHHNNNVDGHRLRLAALIMYWRLHLNRVHYSNRSRSTARVSFDIVTILSHSEDFLFQNNLVF